MCGMYVHNLRKPIFPLFCNLCVFALFVEVLKGFGIYLALSFVFFNKYASTALF